MAVGIRENEREVPLSILKQGDRGTIVALDHNEAIGARLRALGFAAGTVVRVCRVAPFGDPVEYEVRGGRISLRRADARHILVSPIE